MHQLSNGIQTGRLYKGKEVYVQAIPYPMFVTTGLPFWKRWNENNWRPQCECGRIFETLEDYEAHIVYKNSPYGSEQQLNGGSRNDTVKTTDVCY